LIAIKTGGGISSNFCGSGLRGTESTTRERGKYITKGEKEKPTGEPFYIKAKADGRTMEGPMLTCRCRYE